MTGVTAINSHPSLPYWFKFSASFELHFALSGVEMGVVHIDGFILPHLDRSSYSKGISDCFLARLSVTVERGEGQEGKEYLFLHRVVLLRVIDCAS